jgi:biopolymer transport protein ExbD
MAAYNFQNPAADDEVNATINTTPLVDVMLVLLIIFLITVPVVLPSVTLSLPKQTQAAREVRLDSIEISVQRDGALFWNGQPLGEAELASRLGALARQQPQPEVQLRGDEKTRYEAVSRVVRACQKAGIAKVNFVTEPPARS